MSQKAAALHTPDTDLDISDVLNEPSNNHEDAQPQKAIPMARAIKYMPDDANIYVTEKGAAHYLTLAHNTLQKMRTNGTGPDYHVLGDRIVYMKGDIDEWMRTKKVYLNKDI